MKKYPEKVLYMVVDRKDNDTPLCIGYMSEICAYTGKSVNAILSAISHAKSRGTNCQYIRLEDDEEEL